jgi:hypothetical protein
MADESRFAWCDSNFLESKPTAALPFFIDRSEKTIRLHGMRDSTACNDPQAGNDDLWASPGNLPSFYSHYVRDLPTGRCVLDMERHRDDS